MSVGEHTLFALARRFYDSEFAHSAEMKRALRSIDSFDVYRAREFDRVMERAAGESISIRGKVVVDFGCNDGALSQRYLEEGAESVIGVDIDARALARARSRHPDPRLAFVEGTAKHIPLPDASVDVILSYDVFEHVGDPGGMARELFRILKLGGTALGGTQGWYHPFAPHLWSVMPVPWAHVFFPEHTVLSVCQRIYHSDWYKPTMHDFNEDGTRIENKFAHRVISRDYLNHFLIRDFERTFSSAGFVVETRAAPFGSRYARWTRIFLRTPLLREFVTGYVWFVLCKR